MEEYIHKPEGLLSSFVKRIWYNDGYKPSSRVERVLPIDSSQIIINLGDHRFRHFHHSDLNITHEYEDVILTGMHTGHIFLDSHTRISTMGVVLHQGAVPALFKIPTGEFRDEIVSLGELCKADMSELKQKLVAAPTPDKKIGLLESFLKQQLNCDFRPNPAIQLAADQIHRHHGIVSISDLLRQTGYSRRWFAQMFRDTIGTTPKQYARICRFQHVVGLLRKSESLHWADFALQCGYFDQAHFIHDFKDLAGIPPSEYQRNHGEAANHLAL